MTQTKDVRGDDIFDTRDVIARRNELKEERELLASNVADGQSDLHDCTKLAEGEEAEEDAIQRLRDAEEALTDWDTDNAEELAALEAFIEEGTSEFHHGETCIRDSYFERYAEELAEEMGLLKEANSWPLNCIDWKHAARELQYDYSSADLDGVTYWFRS